MVIAIGVDADEKPSDHSFRAENKTVTAKISHQRNDIQAASTDKCVLWPGAGTEALYRALQAVQQFVLLSKTRNVQLMNMYETLPDEEWSAGVAFWTSNSETEKKKKHTHTQAH